MKLDALAKALNLNVVCLAILVSSPPAQAAPIDALRAPDMARLTTELVSLYENAGLSWDHQIEWTIEPYTTTYWYYDPNEDQIVLGDMPQPDQIDHYWQNWSDVLTAGNWSPAGFFTSPAEAEELAIFNQFVLATHETAHALTFRYDYGHLKRHDYDINCREFYADRLTAGLLAEQARQDPDMAHWRQRYLDLVIDMGNAIPEQVRFHIADFASLDKDCTLIEVHQPTPDNMMPYGSAFFERWRVLLSADLPPLQDLFDTHLLQPFAQSQSGIEAVENYDRFSVKNVGPIDLLDLGAVYRDTPEGHTRTRAAAFDPAGELILVELDYDSNNDEVILLTGQSQADLQPIGDAIDWSAETVKVELSSVAAMSPDKLILAIEYFNRNEEEVEEFHVSFVELSRADNVWIPSLMDDLTGFGLGAALRSPTNRLFLAASRDTISGPVSEEWVVLELDAQTYEPLGTYPMPYMVGYPLAVDDEARLYIERNRRIMRFDGTGDYRFVAGTGLSGLREGAADQMEFMSPEVMQWHPTGAHILDLSLHYDHHMRRELHGAP